MALRERIGQTASMTAEAMARVAHEYKDVAKLRDGEKRWYEGVAYVAPLAGSEAVRMGETVRALAARLRLPEGHEADVVFAVPRGAGAVFGRIGSSSAEGATQTLCTLVRRVLDEAGLTVDEMTVEVRLAEEEVA